MKRNVYGDQGAASNVLIAPQSGTGNLSAVDDMSQFDGVAYVLVTTGTLTGAWDVQAADDYAPPTQLQNRYANAGTFGSVKSICSPAIVAVTTASVQPVQLVPCMWGAVKVTWTPTGGAGNVAVYRFKKGNS